MPTADNLFKFMAVRPPQKVSQENLSRRFIRYSRDDSQPKLYAQLLKENSMSQRKDLAAKFVLSASYVSGFRHAAPWVSPLQRLLDILSQVVRNKEPRESAEQAARAWLTQHGQQLPEIRSQLWSSLYAAALAPRTLPQDRNELIVLIRMVFFVEHLAEFDDVHAVNALLRVRPLIPETLFKVAPAVPLPGDEAGKPDAHTWQKQKLELFNRLRDQAFAIEDAMVEIDSGLRRNLYRNSGKRPRPAEPAATTKTATPQGELDGRVIASQSGRPWQIPTDVADAFSEKTRKVVAGSGFSVAGDSAVDILNGLESAQRQCYASIYRLGGLPAVKATGLMRTTMQMEQRPTELLEEMLSSDHLPWLFPVEKRFDETIVGSVGSVKPVGVGDLLVVKESPWKYEMGDVAYIENILKSESRERVHRMLDRNEQTIFSETETTEQSERDLQTAKRFELQSEIQSTIERDSSIGLGVEVSGGYGPVKVTTSADFATSTSQSDSASSASSFAQEITDRSVESLTKRIKESITTTVVSEVEETNRHGFDNTAGTGHICGVYRWVDKYTLGQIYNYGRRLMFEFVVPQPASFYLHARQAADATGTTLSEPVPLAEDFSFSDITPGTYETWVNTYKVTSVAPPPPLYKVIAKAFDQSQTDPVSRSDSLSVPAGYLAKECEVHFSYGYSASSPGHSFHVLVGQRALFLENGDTSDTLHDEDSVVPIGLRVSHTILNYAVTIEVKCRRSEETLQAWQLATYKAIVDAYLQQKSDYDAQLSAAAISQGTAISGNNPDQNRRIEREELKRGCLTLFTDQHFADFDATLKNVAPHGYPELDVDQAMEEARYVQFFEQAFEWDKMSYLFYPYFWGRKEDWAANSQLSDTDPQFTDFLRAGSARVLVPVRPHYEEPIIYYLWTSPGEIWNGGEMPTIHNELYVSIVDELMAAADADLADAVAVGQPWEIKLPTELVKLQEDGTLPDWSTAATPDAPTA